MVFAIILKNTFMVSHKTHNITFSKSNICIYIVGCTKNYQEQALESTGKIVEDYIETQQSVIDSLFSSAAPYYESVSRMYNYWISPKAPAELYTRTVSNIAENISVSARLGNDVLFGNIDAWRNAFEQAQQHTQELSRINTNTAKVIGEAAVLG
jgi:hypothetical protein